MTCYAPPPPFAEQPIELKNTNGITSIKDPVRKRWYVATPEEFVRQKLLAWLAAELKYPLAKMAVEKVLKIDRVSRRFDVLVYGQEHEPWMMIECKAPEVRLTVAALQQALHYKQSAELPLHTNNERTRIRLCKNHCRKSFLAERATCLLAHHNCCCPKCCARLPLPAPPAQ